MPRTPIRPDEILAGELEETGLSAKRLAEAIDAPPNRVYQIVSGKRSITADTALRLERYLGTSPQFWMNLQTAYELDSARLRLGAAIERIPQRGTSSTSGAALDATRSR